MDKVEMVKTAIQELGDVSAAELADFVEKTFGVKIEPRFIPIYKATIRDKERLEKARQAARAAAEQNVAE